MLKKLSIILLVSICYGFSRADETGYRYLPKLYGCLKLYQQPAIWLDAWGSCRREGAEIAAPWTHEFVAALNELQSSDGQLLSVLYSGSRVSLPPYMGAAFLLKGKIALDLCGVWYVNGTRGEVDCNERLPFACYAQASKVAAPKDRSVPSACTPSAYVQRDVPVFAHREDHPTVSESTLLRYPHKNQPAPNGLLNSHSRSKPTTKFRVASPVSPKLDAGHTNTLRPVLTTSFSPAPTTTARSTTTTQTSPAPPTSSKPPPTTTSRRDPPVPPSSTPTFTLDPRCGEQSLGYELADHTGQCYKFHTKSAIWTDANRTCVAEGAQLAVPDNPEETRVLTTLYARYPEATLEIGHNHNYAAVGIYGEGFEGDWRTVNGQTLKELGYANWKQGPPDTAFIYPYVFMNRDGKLINWSANHSVRFFCEKAPAPRR